ncbi:hypothetical protein BD293_3904 [Roseinatronobacter monicus]|uniref:Uncharacterized protein n=1 Tax=Roseinatronobacter monicus TaxID=393481 RepID=A0A543K620_9RHOB|nr:hypothetical protein [Roseinatronobacter monicus]TQM90511.1 hypothetical protein BD293_3904 [Roseinatronobacter monicus]
MNLAALWTYQKDRFPLVRTVPLLAVFSAASISVSAEMAGRPLPGWGAFAAGFAVAMLLFFQMRVCRRLKTRVTRVMLWQFQKSLQTKSIT